MRPATVSQSLTRSVLSKPFSPGFQAVEARVKDAITLGGATDALDQQKWWTLEIEGRHSPWQSSASVPPWVSALVEGDKSWIRQHAVLAMWYPALAAPAGVVPLEALSKAIGGDLEGLAAHGSNIDMSKVGGSAGPGATGTPSHSYLSMHKLPEVWKAFRAFRTVFAE
jgi:hypothetical protein